MTTVPALGDLSTDSRFTRLAHQVRRLRTRSGSGQWDRWLLIVGGLLMPLGILLIILGWQGASHTPLPFEQNDYLISGGILGVALVFAGGFVYFAYWQTLRIRESREQARELTAAIGRLETLLMSGVTGRVTAANGRPSLTQRFVATRSGSIFHRPDCQVVASRTDLKQVDAQRTKLTPCRICDPLATVSA